jgi:hypothetical protein
MLLHELELKKINGLIEIKHENLPSVGGQCAFGCSMDVQTSTQPSLRFAIVFE